MKKFSSIVLIGSLLILASCKKTESNCSGNVEIKGNNHLVDLSVLKTVPQMLDSLEKYPNLQAASIMDDEYMTSLSCNYFYNNLIVFGASYTLTKSKKFGYFECADYRPKVNLPTNLVKNIDDKKAIEIAKKEINLDGKCLSYQLGYSYQDTTNIETTSNYKLVWNIKSGSAYVILDATNGNVYAKFDGIFTIK
jgi:Zn-dependent metalloprotease